MKKESLEQKKRRMARAMSFPNKSVAQAHYKAVKHHKTRPQVNPKVENRNTDYRKMSLEEFEDKYGKP